MNSRAESAQYVKVYSPQFGPIVGHPLVYSVYFRVVTSVAQQAVKTIHPPHLWARSPQTLAMHPTILELHHQVDRQAPDNSMARSPPTS